MIPIGSPAKGRDFIDREVETAYILKKIQKENIMLIAPRRYGKTSVMRKVESLLLLEHNPCIYLDVMSVESPRELIRNIIYEIGRVDDRKFQEKIKTTYTLLKSKLDSIQAVSVAMVSLTLKDQDEFEKRRSWKEYQEYLIDFFNSLDSRFYIILDEFPSAIQNMKPDDAKIFLEWFRSLRQISSEKAGFLLGGSVSIDSVIRLIDGHGVINDFKRYTIEGFERGIAEKLIIDSLDEEGILYEDGVPEEILEYIGYPYIPYFIAVLLDSICDEYVRFKDPLNRERIQNIYQHYILGNRGKHYFDHYYERLGKFYKNNESAAKKILRETAISGTYDYDHARGIYSQETGDTSPEKFEGLIAELENDFYVVHDRDTASLKFKSQILRDWWRNFHANE